MVNHNSRGLVMDLVDAGVYEKDFELVWANKRNVDGGDDESSSPYTPNTPDASSPIDKPITKSEYTGCCDSTSTTAASSTVTSMSIVTTSAITATSPIHTQTFQDASDRSTSMTSISSSSCFPSSTSSISTPTMDALTSSPTSTSNLSPNPTTASTTTSIMNATALNENSSTFSPLPDTQGTFTKHEHTSSALAVIVSVTVVVSLIALAVVAFLVRRKLRKQSKRNEELEERGEKPVTGVEAGMGIRKNENGGSGGDTEAPRPEMKRNPSVSVSEAGNEATLDRAEMETVRARSTISSGWGDGLSIHSLELNESEPVQGLSIRPQTRSPPGRNEYDSDINSYYEATKHGHDPFADPEPENGNLNMVPGFQPINLRNLDFDKYRSDTNPTSPGDLTRDYLRNKNAILSGRREPSVTSETDILERQREMEGGDSGEITEQPRAGRWSNPFTAREKRGTRAYEEMGGEERREGRWRDARSWVKGQVERVKDR
ncbi:31f47c82-d44c-41e1-bfb9-bc3c6f419792 [Sclerotinia trifoliorum]|uniref:31f47c82-d44c-41e1-bfb9-bc3c6f419792 n=1 Tax=Sclerotinia trifoliorum TaxID=28548 RepID=A0A8H2ZM00_9HELO|nr:31f47c82-d44c-41e1-bfb9-bc3c6f419792 [Sclerotinia trifoliorum]